MRRGRSPSLVRQLRMRIPPVRRGPRTHSGRRRGCTLRRSCTPAAAGGLRGGTSRHPAGVEVGERCLRQANIRCPRCRARCTPRNPQCRPNPDPVSTLRSAGPRSRRDPGGTCRCRSRGTRCLRTLPRPIRTALRTAPRRWQRSVRASWSLLRAASYRSRAFRKARAIAARARRAVFRDVTWATCATAHPTRRAAVRRRSRFPAMVRRRVSARRGVHEAALVADRWLDMRLPVTRA
jgi:hypothetical protein